MMEVGRNIRLAVLVMAEASVPSRLRLAFGAGSQGTVTIRSRVAAGARVLSGGCHAWVAAMAYSAGQQRRMLQCAAGCTAHSVATAYSFGVIRSALVPLHAWGWKMVSVGLYVLAIAAKRLWHSSLFGPCGCSRVATPRGTENALATRRGAGGSALRGVQCASSRCQGLMERTNWLLNKQPRTH